MLCGGLPGKDPDGWLTHFAVQQKLAQQCKATALQQKLTISWLPPRCGNRLQIYSDESCGGLTLSLLKALSSDRLTVT